MMCQKEHFSRHLTNGDSVTRNWLIYSPSTGKIPKAINLVNTYPRDLEDCFIAEPLVFSNKYPENKL